MSQIKIKPSRFSKGCCRRCHSIGRHAGDSTGSKRIRIEPHPADDKWAMVIDQSKCTGCGYCVMACRAHNDVPPDISWNPVLEGWSDG